MSLRGERPCKSIRMDSRHRRLSPSLHNRSGRAGLIAAHRRRLRLSVDDRIPIRHGIFLPVEAQDPLFVRGQPRLCRSVMTGLVNLFPYPLPVRRRSNSRRLAMGAGRVAPDAKPLSTPDPNLKNQPTAPRETVYKHGPKNPYFVHNVSVQFKFRQVLS